MKFNYAIMSMQDELQKIAYNQEFKDKAKIIGKNLAAFGLGATGGVLLAEGANRLSERVRGKPISPAVVAALVPILGLSANIVYNHAKNKEKSELDNVSKIKANRG